MEGVFSIYTYVLNGGEPFLANICTYKLRLELLGYIYTESKGGITSQEPWKREMVWSSKMQIEI